MVKIVHSSGMGSGALVGLAAGLGKMGYDAHKKAQAKREEEEATAAEEAEVEARQQELRQMLAYEGAPSAVGGAVGAAGGGVGAAATAPSGGEPFDLRTDPVFMEQVAGLPKEKRDLMMYLAETKYQGERDQQARAHVRNMLEMGGELLQNDMEGVQMIVEGMEAGLIDAPQAAEAIQDKISQANMKMARAEVAESAIARLQADYGSALNAADHQTTHEVLGLFADVRAGAKKPEEIEGRFHGIMAEYHGRLAKGGATQPAPQFGAMSPAADGSAAGDGGETEQGSDSDLLGQIHKDKDELEELRRGQHKYGPGETPPTDEEIESFVPPGDLRRVEPEKKRRKVVSGGAAAAISDRSKK